jgi:hypothetical protein
MSSHHFVREGQEPALLILDPLSYADAEGLLEWAPLVVVVESALDEVLLWGIKVDVVIAHENRIAELTTQLVDQAPLKIVSAGENALEASLLFLSASGQGAVSILSDKFTDDLRLSIESLPSKLQVTVRTKSEKWAWIQSGNYKKWLQAGSIIDFSDKSLAAQISSLKKIESGFEVVEDQWISIQSTSPFWVAEFA